MYRITGHYPVAPYRPVVVPEIEQQLSRMGHGAAGWWIGDIGPLTAVMMILP